MKLKQKLAFEYEDPDRTKHSEDELSGNDREVYLAYLAGFEKARELAFNKTEELQLPYQSLKNQTCAEIGSRILELGEEEV